MKLNKAGFFLVAVLIFLPGCSSGDKSVSTVNDEALNQTGLQNSLPSFKTGEIDSQSFEGVDFAIEPQFDRCSPAIEGIIGTEKGTGDDVRYGFVDSEGRMIADTVYEAVKYYVGASSASSGFSEGLAPVSKNGKWGYIDINGKAVIDFTYDDAQLFNEGYGAVKIGSKYGYINKSGKMVIQPAFDLALEMHNGIAVAETNGKYGIINNKGSWIEKPAYDYIDLGRHDNYWTESNMLTYYQYDHMGIQHMGIFKIENGGVSILVEPRYLKLYPFYNDEAMFVRAIKNNEGELTDKVILGYINKAGKETVSWEENGKTEYGRLSEGLRTFKGENGKWGYVDAEKKLKISCAYDSAGEFEKGWALVHLGEKVGLIDKKGRTLLKPIYDSILPLQSQGCIIVEQNNQKSLFSADSFLEISDAYDDMGSGKKALPVNKNGRIGYIDTKGRQLVPPTYDGCYDFAFWEPYVWVRQDDAWMCVDESGSVRFSMELDEVASFTDGCASVRKDGKWGVVNTRGEVLVPFVFEEAGIEGKGLVKVKAGDRYGFIKVKTVADSCNRPSM